MKTAVVACDLSQAGFLDELRAVTDGLDVGLLVSNAGAGALGAMLRVDPDELAAWSTAVISTACSKRSASARR